MPKEINAVRAYEERVSVPTAGDPASALDIERVAQRMLNNDLFLKRLTDALLAWMAATDTDGDGKVDQARAADAVPWSGVQGKPATFPTTWNEVQGKPSAFPVNWDSVSGKPATFPTTWNEVQGKPSAFPTDWGLVQGKPSAFPTDWGLVQGKPSAFPGPFYTSTPPADAPLGSVWVRPSGLALLKVAAQRWRAFQPLGLVAASSRIGSAGDTYDYVAIPASIDGLSVYRAYPLSVSVEFWHIGNAYPWFSAYYGVPADATATSIGEPSSTAGAVVLRTFNQARLMARENWPGGGGLGVLSPGQMLWVKTGLACGGWGDCPSLNTGAFGRCEAHFAMEFSV